MINAAVQLLKLNELPYSGADGIRIGIIDGPVFTGHPEFQESIFVSPQGSAVACAVDNSPACQHGTFVTGILAANSFGLCPEATFIVRPIFCEAVDFRNCPLVTPDHLAEAVHDVLDQRAQIINMSLGLSPGDMRHFRFDRLHEAYDRAHQQGALVVAASGNYAGVGSTPILKHPWVIPVVACDAQGRMLPMSSTGRDIARQGVMAPGLHIQSTSVDGGTTTMTGTSVATPFVSGTLARVLAIQPGMRPENLRQTIGSSNRRQSIIPVKLDAERIYIETTQQKVA